MSAPSIHAAVAAAVEEYLASKPPALVRLPAQARALGIPAKRLRQDVAAGRITCHRRGSAGWIYFSAADVEAYLRSQRRGSAA